MKAVALILALAVIGCNARSLPEVSKPWEATVEKFWQHINNLNQRADGVVQDIKASQLSRELDTLITDTMAELNAYKADLQTKLSAYGDASNSQIIQDLQLLTDRLQRDMLDGKERSTEYLGELKTMVEHNADEVRGRVSTYTNKLKKRLHKDTEEIVNTVATYMSELQSRTFQNVQTMREQVEPQLQQAGEVANQKLIEITTMLKSQIEGVAKRLETQAAGMRTQFEEVRTALEGNIDQLTKLVQPYATQVREQIESIAEKVKQTAQ